MSFRKHYNVTPPTHHHVPPGVKPTTPNPWKRNVRGRDTEAVDTVTRGEIVREAPIDKLRLIIAWPGTQKIIRLLAEKRLRSLERKGSDPFDAMRAERTREISMITVRPEQLRNVRPGSGRSEPDIEVDTNPLAIAKRRAA